MSVHSTVALSPLESQPTRPPANNNHLPETDLDRVFETVFRRLAVEREDARRMASSRPTRRRLTSAVVFGPRLSVPPALMSRRDTVEVSEGKDTSTSRTSRWGANLLSFVRTFLPGMREGRPSLPPSPVPSHAHPDKSSTSIAGSSANSSTHVSDNTGRAVDELIDKSTPSTQTTTTTSVHFAHPRNGHLRARTMGGGELSQLAMQTSSAEASFEHPRRQSISSGIQLATQNLSPRASFASLKRRHHAAASIGLSVEPAIADAPSSRTRAASLATAPPRKYSHTGLLNMLMMTSMRASTPPPLQLATSITPQQTAVARSLLFKACLMHEYGLTLRAVLGRPPIGDHDVPAFMDHGAADVYLLRHFMQPGSIVSVVGNPHQDGRSPLTLSPSSSTPSSFAIHSTNAYDRTPHKRMATRLLALAASEELGAYPLATYCYAHLLLAGYGCDRDQLRARDLLIRAAHSGEPLAMYDLARGRCLGGALALSPRERLDWLKRAAKHPLHPSADACYDLGQMYVDPESDIAREFSSQDAVNGSTITATRTVTPMFASASAVLVLRKDKRKAAKYFRRCIALGRALPDSTSRWIYKRKYL